MSFKDTIPKPIFPTGEVTGGMISVPFLMISDSFKRIFFSGISTSNKCIFW